MAGGSPLWRTNSLLTMRLIEQADSFKTSRVRMRKKFVFHVDPAAGEVGN